VSPVVLKAMKKGNLKSFVSGERSRALWAFLFELLNSRKKRFTRAYTECFTWAMPILYFLESCC